MEGESASSSSPRSGASSPEQTVAAVAENGEFPSAPIGDASGGADVSSSSSNDGFHVRLTLTVGATNSRFLPGLEIEDCGMCIFCRDKPKFGGPGTKRQKCELKELAPAPDAETAEPYDK